MNNKGSQLFGSLPEKKAKLIAWVVIGLALYLHPFIFLTVTNIGTSSGAISPWLPEGTEERQLFSEFAERFESFDSILVSWEGAEDEDPLFRTLTERIIKTDRMRAFQTGEEPLVGSIVTLSTFIDSFGEKYSEDPAFREKVSKATAGYLVSKQMTTGVLLVESTKFGADHREMTFNMVDRIVREELPEGIEPKYAGPCFLSICANKENSKVLQLITPISAIISLMAALFFLRNPVLTITALGISGLAATLSISAMYVGGETLGNMLSMVPCLAQLLAMSNVIHFINYYMESLAEHRDKERAWRDAISNGWLPTVAAAVTTVVGFTALLSTNIGVVKSFAKFGAISVVISMVIVMTVTPAALILLKPDIRPQAFLQRKFLQGLKTLVPRYHKAITIVLISFFGLCIAGLGHLKSDIRMGSFFSEDSRYRSDLTWFESKMGPIIGSELSVTFSGNVDLDTQFAIVDETARKVQELDREYSVFSPAVIDELLPEESSETVWKKVEKSGLGALEDGKYHWRLSVRHPLEPDPSESVFQSRITSLIQDIETDPDIAPRDRPSIALTGAFQLFSKSQDGLLNQLLRSFLCAFLVITPIIMIFLRSVSLGFVAMVGNLFPLGIFFGTLGWIDFRIDVATMMTAAIAFGIAVDDTMHFLTWLSRGMRRYENVTEAVRFAFSNCASAILQTTLIISLGMTAAFLTDFQPSLRFAVFSGLVLIIALIGDLILLPATILGLFRRLFEKKKS